MIFFKKESSEGVNYIGQVNLLKNDFSGLNFEWKSTSAKVGFVRGGKLQDWHTKKSCDAVEKPLFILFL